MSESIATASGESVGMTMETIRELVSNLMKEKVKDVQSQVPDGKCFILS